VSQDDASREPVVPEDPFTVAIFTLADHAEAVAATGKLYINGAGVGTILMQDAPGQLPPLYLALRLRIPWHKTTEPFLLRIRALNADRTPVERDPLLEVRPEVGRPAGVRPGDEMAMNAVVGIGGMSIREHGTIYFHLEVEGEVIAIQPLKVASMRDPRIGLVG
jgi:Family of unknown function (DUF6941)